MFSSADVDSGTRLLLKILSQIIDEDTAAGKPLPRRVLDAGCGAGIIGICAAAALPGSYVRSQDRDELARLFTLHNAAKNNIPAPMLEAYTEPLLAGPSLKWDLILTNIPAKAGLPVLEDFVRRSAGLLNPGGRVGMVAVNTLAEFFRSTIAAAGAELLNEHRGSGYTVFIYGGNTVVNLPLETVNIGPDFFTKYPFYIRAAAVYAIEKIPVRLETIHGAAGFDNPGGAVLAAAKLVAGKLSTANNFEICRNAHILVHEPGQGFFPRWLIGFLHGKQTQTRMVLSGRNILALEAARHNTGEPENPPLVVPAVDLQLGTAALLEAAGGRQYTLIAAFPELLPQISLKRNEQPKKHPFLIHSSFYWDPLPSLLAPGGIFLAAFSSTDAERFDRIKPPGFTRMGTVKRDGFRALVYIKK